MSITGRKAAEQFHKEGTVADLSGDDLTLTVTAVEAVDRPIYIDSVRGSVDGDADFSIVDSGGKVIVKLNLPSGGVVNLNPNDFSSADYADAGEDLEIKFEAAATPTKVFLQVNAFAFTGN